MAAAVLSGTYEFGKSSLLAAVNAHIHNLPLTVIAAGAVYDSKTPFAELCVASDSPLASGKDFEGKTIGTPALNDLNQLVVSAWVDGHGGDFENAALRRAAAVDHRSRARRPPCRRVGHAAADAGRRGRDQRGQSAGPRLRCDRADVRVRRVLHLGRLRGKPSRHRREIHARALRGRGVHQQASCRNRGR